MLGGWSSEGYKRFGDVYLFDTNTAQLKKAMPDGQMKFNALGNQCGRSDYETVSALVSDANHLPCIIEYRKGADQINILEKF